MRKLQLQVINLLAMFTGTENLQNMVFQAPKLSRVAKWNEYLAWKGNKQGQCRDVCKIMSIYFFTLYNEPKDWQAPALTLIGKRLGMLNNFQNFQECAPQKRKIGRCALVRK